MNKENKIVTISVPPKYMKTLKEFCSVMNFSVLTVEQTVKKKTIDCWEDIYKYVEEKLGPGSIGERFINDLITVSPLHATTYLLRIITSANYPDNESVVPTIAAGELADKLQNPDKYFPSEYVESIKIIRDKLLPLLNEGKEE